jgi:hypothetical protein
MTVITKKFESFMKYRFNSNDIDAISSLLYHTAMLQLDRVGPKQVFQFSPAAQVGNCPNLATEAGANMCVSTEASAALHRFMHLLQISNMREMPIEYSCSSTVDIMSSPQFRAPSPKSH